ncbi:MAG: hypothetical protein BM556_04670 [Bacteriovorax sp. MedPE-SWde]|nr:MAG: hypothetical protein BM556_04670 [Bacteriovorax sp. MedPE-SWde]
MAKKKLIVKCAKCKKEFNYYDSEFRPFCCEKCKMIDLGLWVTGSYTVASNQPLSESDVEVILREQEKRDYGEDD